LSNIEKPLAILKKLGNANDTQWPGQTHQVSEKKNRSKGICCGIWFLGFDIE
jgi:hypothetical protein